MAHLVSVCRLFRLLCGRSSVLVVARLISWLPLSNILVNLRTVFLQIFLSFLFNRLLCLIRHRFFSWLGANVIENLTSVGTFKIVISSRCCLMLWLASSLFTLLLRFLTNLLSLLGQIIKIVVLAHVQGLSLVQERHSLRLNKFRTVRVGLNCQMDYSVGAAVVVELSKGRWFVHWLVGTIVVVRSALLWFVWLRLVYGG